MASNFITKTTFLVKLPENANIPQKSALLRSMQDQLFQKEAAIEFEWYQKDKKVVLLEVQTNISIDPKSLVFPEGYQLFAN